MENEINLIVLRFPVLVWQQKDLTLWGNHFQRIRNSIAEQKNEKLYKILFKICNQKRMMQMKKCSLDGRFEYKTWKEEQKTSIMKKLKMIPTNHLISQNKLKKSPITQKLSTYWFYSINLLPKEISKFHLSYTIDQVLYTLSSYLNR